MSPVSSADTSCLIDALHKARDTATAMASITMELFFCAKEVQSKFPYAFRPFQLDFQLLTEFSQMWKPYSDEETGLVAPYLDNMRANEPELGRKMRTQGEYVRTNILYAGHLIMCVPRLHLPIGVVGNRNYPRSVGILERFCACVTLWENDRHAPPSVRGRPADKPEPMFVAAKKGGVVKKKVLKKQSPKKK